ncbi:glycosyl hydrolase family 18 protein [Cellulosilyticum sp. I15G10I2]|uniref:glycosyl hydrolase family 18 protein n=1 Tax=Cellulosilyticum sp. I15G10I2 TaxID=1892843 RepID=UPI00085BEFFB|nr:glycosyl hydrolase family 18 protein [Cellulosilyticum sp. I15G10I2]
MLKKVIFGIMAMTLVIIAVYKWMPVGKEVDPLIYFNEFRNNVNNLVYEDERVALNEPAMMIDNEIYVSYEFAREYISDTIFYDEEEKALTITNVRELLRLYEGALEGRLNFDKIAVKNPVKEVDHIIYIPAGLISERFGIDITRGKDNRVFIASDKTKEKQLAVLKRNTSLRTHPQNRTTVIEPLKKGQKVIIYKEESDFLRVRSENGIIGFIPKADIKDAVPIDGQLRDVVEALPMSKPLNDKVKLVWDQLGSKTPGDWTSPKYTNIKGANVISPTWFEFEDDLGNLTDRGTRQYVIEAKKRNLQVWPLMSHNFTQPALTKPILSSTAKRQHVIDQIIKKAEEYGYDGINIDIENIQPETSDVWVQFMRELYPLLKEVGLSVSVDVYMPSDWSRHYQREKIAEVCDYFIVMAYDQHWSGSENAGSVSELSWVEEGIKRNLLEVEKEKLVLGIPFYTRIWEETDEGLKTKAYGMKPAWDMVKTWGVTPVLDEISGQKYAEIEKVSSVFKVWLEDESSIQKRIELLNQYDLAGYGAWKLGLETPDIWHELQKVQ